MKYKFLKRNKVSPIVYNIHFRLITRSSIISIEIGDQWLEIQWKYQELVWHVMRIKVSAVHPRIAHSESQNVMFWHCFSTECAHVSKLYNLRHDFVFFLMENSMRLFVWFIHRILGYLFSLFDNFDIIIYSLVLMYPVICLYMIYCCFFWVLWNIFYAAAIVWLV